MPWVVLTEDKPAALISIWGSSNQDVWVVGGDPGDGGGPFVFHYDGASWQRLDSGLRGVDLWWVFGFAGGPVFASGDNGTILRYEGDSFTPLPTPSQASRVFGLWGAAPDDLWAVGGQTGPGILWRFDGTTWTEVAEAPDDIATGGSFFKVNGLTTDDVWIACSSGATLHWNGSALEREDLPVTAPLLSIARTPERVIAVGGAFDGVLFENEGGEWQAAIPTGGPRLAGVAAFGADAYAVGEFGTILRRGGDGTWAAEAETATTQNLHATWIDPSGGVWAVGGEYELNPMRDGVLVYKGEPLEGSFP